MYSTHPRCCRMLSDRPFEQHQSAPLGGSDSAKASYGAGSKILRRHVAGLLWCGRLQQLRPGSHD